MIKSEKYQIKEGVKIKRRFSECEWTQESHGPREHATVRPEHMYIEQLTIKRPHGIPAEPDLFLIYVP